MQMFAGDNMEFEDKITLLQWCKLYRIIGNFNLDDLSSIRWRIIWTNLKFDYHKIPRFRGFIFLLS